VLVARRPDQAPKSIGIDTVKLTAGGTANCPGTVYYGSRPFHQAIQTLHIIKIAFDPSGCNICRLFVK
jgi:hypothetical protein